MAPNYLTRLRTARQRRDAAFEEASRRIAALALEANAAGVHFADIAEAVGLSRQALHAFIKRHAPES